MCAGLARTILKFRKKEKNILESYFLLRSDSAFVFFFLSIVYSNEGNSLVNRVTDLFADAIFDVSNFLLSYPFFPMVGDHPVDRKYTYGVVSAILISIFIFFSNGRNSLC